MDADTMIKAKEVGTPQARSRDVGTWIATHFKGDGRRRSSSHFVVPFSEETQGHFMIKHRNISSSLTAQLQDSEQRRADRLRGTADRIFRSGLSMLAPLSRGPLKPAVDDAGPTPSHTSCRSASPVGRARSTAPDAAHRQDLVDRVLETADGEAVRHDRASAKADDLPRLTRKTPNIRGRRPGAAQHSGPLKPAVDDAGPVPSHTSCRSASPVGKARSTAPDAAHRQDLVDRVLETADGEAVRHDRSSAKADDLPRLTRKTPNIRGRRPGAAQHRPHSTSPTRTAVLPLPSCSEGWQGHLVEQAEANVNNEAPSSHSHEHLDRRRRTNTLTQWLAAHVLARAGTSDAIPRAAVSRDVLLERPQPPLASRLFRCLSLGNHRR